MTPTQQKLEAISDNKYAEFAAKLTPGIDEKLFLGVRNPDMRKFAKSYFGSDEANEFLSELPHKYYDENMLHAMLICEVKDYDKCLVEVERFLPYIDNWAVCDTFSPKVFFKNKDKLLSSVKKWISSEHTYTKRYGIVMLMRHYLDECFDRNQLDLIANIKSDEYYINMAVAWYFATALAKQWEDTVPYIKEKKLDKWTHNKAIQKARESFRVSDERKEYLKTLKMK